ncbi:hypothetical protein F4824DRAFT_458529 [Ustulina deusta]|nr:hypothetical protein F4823DRAFT_591481 [Ustulina deusta]KAI3338689.1 hypothetical protein F4824DRAFT_458529 [Ustulina deusta]
MSKDEQIPFIDRDQNGCDENLQSSLVSNHVPREQSIAWTPVQKLSVVANFLLLSVVFFLAATIALQALGSRQRTCDDGVFEPYSPAAASIEYQYRALIPNDTRFTGHPGPEWERSMHELMEGTLIRISEHELKQSGSDSIPLKDGGYAAGLGVGHNLHCVKKIKQFLYREHFYPNLSDNKDEFDYVQSHADHCLDFLRQAMLCHLDYSLYTLYWGERRQDIPTHRIPDGQKCINWDKLHSWMRSRSANTDMLLGP